MAPGASLPITVAFNPTTPGSLTASLVIDNDGSAPRVDMTLTGNAVSNNPVLTITVPNNLGGIRVGELSNTAQQTATIENTGSQPLIVSGISVVSGNSVYSLSGLPGSFPATPIILSPGSSFQFQVDFNPSSIGLLRGAIDITSNDPTNPSDVLHVTGTGLPATGSALHYANDYVAIEFPDLPGSTVLRTISDSMGNFSFFMPPDTNYHYAIFDPISGLIANGYGRTARSGQNTMLSIPVFLASTANDTGGDGLPDDVEFAIGLSPTGPQISADGIDYFTHVVTDHTNPLLGKPVITGVLASLQLQGQATAVTLQGSPTNSQGQTAYVATGTYGLAIVNATQFQKPVLLGQIQLTGTSSDVSVDPNLNIAAVASNTGGLNLVNVSNPMQPKLLKNINVNAKAVRVVNGVAYAAVGTGVRTYDLLTGSLLQTLNLSGGSITSMAIEGTFVYTLDSANTLRVIDLSGSQMVARGSVTFAVGSGNTLSSGSDALFVGNGIAYVGVTRYLQPPLGALSGYITANVSNPTSPIALSGFPTSDSAGQGVAANGSGIALTVGSDLTGSAVDVFNSSNTSTAGQFVTQFALPVAAQGIAIGEGIAFVADGSSGLQVVNYLPFDTNGIPPTASISTTATDVDLITPGLQVHEGSTLPIQAVVNDDGQVRNVELLVNGQVVQNAVSFPFNFSVHRARPSPPPAAVSQFSCSPPIPAAMWGCPTS